MTKHSKFIFQELPKNQVVNLYDIHEIDCEKDDLINQVIAQHLQTIVTDDNHILDNGKDSLEGVNLEELKSEYYNKGLDDAKASYEKIIHELRIDNNLAENLAQKISSIVPDVKFDRQAVRLALEIISNIAEKLHLMITVDFEQIIRNEIIQCIKKYYKEGQVTINVNPEKYDLCKNIFELENLPLKLKNNIQIIPSDDIAINDCKLSWSETSLEYSQSQIAQEIDEIMQKIKNSL